MLFPEKPLLLPFDPLSLMQLPACAQQGLHILELRTAQVVQELGVLLEGPVDGDAGGAMPNGNGLDYGGGQDGYGGAGAGGYDYGNGGINGTGGAGGGYAY